MSLPANIAKLEPEELESRWVSGSVIDEQVGTLDRKYQSIRKSTWSTVGLWAGMNHTHSGKYIWEVQEPGLR